MFQNQQLSSSQILVIKGSVTLLHQHGDLLASKFYTDMLSNFPELKSFFNVSDQKLMRQPKILAYALLAYASNIDNPQALLGFINIVASKHVGLQVKPQHYKIVGQCLLNTLRELLGPKIATEDFLEAWSIAYENLAKIFIDIELEMYSKNEWDGFRDFKVTYIEKEAKGVKSIYFSPLDGGNIQVPEPGQYVCIRWILPNYEFEQSRTYSLSQTPAHNQYRISVRLLEDGLVSKFIHEVVKVGDVLKVAPPSGLFNYRDAESSNRIVAFAGGIGITPLIAIIERALSKGHKVILHFSNKDRKSRPFESWLIDLKNKHDSFQLVEYMSQEAKSVENEDGPIDKLFYRRIIHSDLSDIDPINDVIYIVGPPQYMTFLKEIMKTKNVPESHVHLEFFGPTQI